MNIWFWAFMFSYASTIVLAYTAYLSKIVKRIRYGNRFLSYQIIDTGERGEHVFKDGVNDIGGIKRMFIDGCDYHGTVYYEKRNAEFLKIDKEKEPDVKDKPTKPLKIKQDLQAYRYYCDTKNFDTNHRNDILETLFVLNAKQTILLLIVMGIIITLVGIGINYLIINNARSDLLDSIKALKDTLSIIPKAPDVETIGGS